MTTIQGTNTTTLLEASAGDFVGPEAQIELLLMQLQESSQDAERARSAETRQRFERAEAGLELQRDAIRTQLFASIAGGIAKIGSGVGAMASAFGPHGEGGDPVGDSAASKIGGVSTMVSTTMGAVEGLVGNRVAGLELRASAAKLDAERAQHQAGVFGEQAENDRTVRENLLRQLEAVLQQRRQGDDTAAQALR